MSTIRVDDVGPSAGGTTKSLVRGTASAWVNFDGTGTIAARDSENVSSLTDNGTGDYTVNFTNAMGNANYATIGMGSAADSGNTRTFNLAEGGTYSTTAVQVLSERSNDGENRDNTHLNVAILGDLA